MTVPLYEGVGGAHRLLLSGRAEAAGLPPGNVFTPPPALPLRPHLVSTQPQMPPPHKLAGPRPRPHMIPSQPAAPPPHMIPSQPPAPPPYLIPSQPAPPPPQPQQPRPLWGASQQASLQPQQSLVTPPAWAFMTRFTTPEVINQMRNGGCVLRPPPHQPLKPPPPRQQYPKKPMPVSRAKKPKPPAGPPPTVRQHQHEVAYPKPPTTPYPWRIRNPGNAFLRGS